MRQLYSPAEILLYERPLIDTPEPEYTAWCEKVEAYFTAKLQNMCYICGDPRYAATQDGPVCWSHYHAMESL